MLTDRELRSLLGSLDMAEPPDPAFASGLEATLLAARRRSPVQLWFLRLDRMPAAAWVALLALLITAVAFAAVAGAGPIGPRLRAELPPSEALPPATSVDHRIPLQAAAGTIAFDSAGTVWASTAGGLERYGLVDGRTTAGPGLHGATVASVAFTRGGVPTWSRSFVWIASHDPGTLMRVEPGGELGAATVSVDAPDAISADARAVAPAILVVSRARRTVTMVESTSLDIRWRVAIDATPIAAADGGGRVWVAVRPTGVVDALAVTELDIATGAPIGTVDLGVDRPIEPGGMAVSSSGSTAGHLFVVDASRGALVEVDPATRTVVRRLQIGARPSLVVECPDGSLIVAYEARSGIADGIAVVDPVTGAVRRHRLDADRSSGRGVTAIGIEQYEEGRLSGTSWHAWVATDWTGAASVGRLPFDVLH